MVVTFLKRRRLPKEGIVNFTGIQEANSVPILASSQCAIHYSTAKLLYIGLCVHVK